MTRIFLYFYFNDDFLSINLSFLFIVKLIDIYIYIYIDIFFLVRKRMYNFSKV